MKTQRYKVAKLMLGRTAIAIAAIVWLGSSLSAQAAPGKPSQGGGLPHPTASTVRQLIADINYANNTGGAITINLAPGATFDLKSADNTTDGGNGLPVIGGTKAVDLTIIGNGATIRRIAVIDRNYIVKNPFRLFDVAAGASLKLDQVTVNGGYLASGGGILNHGTLNVINGSTLSGNVGCAIYNNGGTVTFSNSTLSNNSGTGGGIYNAGGTVTVGDGSLLLGNRALYNGGGIYNNGGIVTVSDGTLYGNSARFGGGIYNAAGTVTLNPGSIVSGNFAFHADYPWSGGDGGGIYNHGTLTISGGTVIGNTADADFGSGGGIYNDGTVTVQNFSNITGNKVGDFDEDVANAGLLYLDGTSTIGTIEGNYAWASGAAMYAPLADAQTTDTVIISKADFRRTTGILYVAASSSLANVTMDVYATSSTLGTWWIGTLTPIGGGKFKGSFTPPVSPASYDGPRTITVQSSGGGSATRDIKIR